MYGELFRTLSQEGYVIQSCLTIGLTELRNANLNEKGRYYTAFFQLAIGIERLAKLALILDHMEQNQLQAPGRPVLKSYGHDLRTLISNVSNVASTRGHTLSTPFPTDPLCTRVVAFLSDFATGMRYANLDALATGKSHRDPLGEWNEILQHTFATKVSEATKHKINTRATAIAEALEGHASVFASDLAGNPLTLSSAFSEPSVLDAASKYLIWEICTLLAPLRDCVVSAGYAVDAVAVSIDPNGDRVPTLREFFDFLWLDRKSVFRKKRWP
jgi:hypothetical protein